MLLAIRDRFQFKSDSYQTRVCVIFRWIEGANFMKKCDERGAIVIEACVADGSAIDLNSNVTRNGKVRRTHIYQPFIFTHFNHFGISVHQIIYTLTRHNCSSLANDYVIVKVRLEKNLLPIKGTKKL